MQVRRISAVAVLFAAILVASAAAQDQIEISGGNQVVGDGDIRSALYAPSVLQRPDGEILMFVQGFKVNQPGVRDAIQLYRSWNPTAPFWWDSVIIGDTTYFYGHPDAVAAPPSQPARCPLGGTEYFLSASRSPDASTFNHILWATSCNGMNWTFESQPILTWAGGWPNVDIPGITVKPRTIGNVKYLYGFMDVGIDGAGFGIGMIRLRRAANARGFDQIEIYTDTGWRTTNQDGSFAFYPAIVIPGAGKAKFDNSNELFVSYGADFPGACNCPPRTGTYENAIRFYYVTIDVNNPNAIPAFSGNNIYSYIRCLPGWYDNSRTYPARLEGTNYMYSTTQDFRKTEGGFAWPPSCGPLSTYQGASIVVTSLGSPSFTGEQ